MNKRAFPKKSLEGGLRGWWRGEVVAGGERGGKNQRTRVGGKGPESTLEKL